jgi:hypothetical protein
VGSKIHEFVDCSSSINPAKSLTSEIKILLSWVNDTPFVGRRSDQMSIVCHSGHPITGLLPAALWFTLGLSGAGVISTDAV